MMEEIGEEYKSSLADLTVNSKPLITMLTMLAEENKKHAPVIVKSIEEHIKKCTGLQKLHALYLLDSIMKNVGGEYIRLFGLNIINTFEEVFLKNEEKVRKKLYELRLTWNDVLPKSRLYMLDVTVQRLDPAWPMNVPPPETVNPPKGKTIFINPNHIKGSGFKDIAAKKTTLTQLELKKREEELYHEKRELEKMKKEEELIQKEKKKLEMIKASQTIHIDPERVKQVLPSVMAGSGDKRVEKGKQTSNKSTKSDVKDRDSTDYKKKTSNEKQSTVALPKQRDPRLVKSVGDQTSRNPRLAAPTTKFSSPPLAVSTPKPSTKPCLQNNSKKEVEMPKIRERDKDPNKKTDASVEAKLPTRITNDRKKDEETKNKRNQQLTLESKGTHKSSTSKKSCMTNNKPAEKKEKLSPSDQAKARDNIRRIEDLHEDIDSDPEPMSSKEMFRSLNQQDSESDSDHYEGNKPPQLLINKKGKYSSGDDEKGNTNESLISANKSQLDTDFRQYNKGRAPGSDEPSNKSADNMDMDTEPEMSLFGKEDVDLRQITGRGGLPPGGPFSSHPLLPPVKLPTAFQSASDSVAIPPMEMGLRQTNVDETTNFNLDNMDKMGESMTKLSVNSNHSASWEKFREKNPEFQKYQIAASVPDCESNYFADAEDDESRPHDKDKSFPAKQMLPQSPQADPFPQDNLEEQEGFATRNEAMKNNYKSIILQAGEQLNKQEINLCQYNQLLSTVVRLMEQDKIKEARRAEKSKFNSSSYMSSRIDKGNEKWSPGSRDNYRSDELGDKSMHMSGDLSRMGHGSGNRRGHNDRWSNRNKRGRGHISGGPRLPPSWHSNMDDISSNESELELDEEYTNEPDLPAVPESILRQIDKEPCTRTIDIDQIPREIRTYGETAIILIDYRDPRFISFESGRCNIIFDNNKFVMPMAIGEDYKDFTIDGENHRIKLGVPTQELFIDGKGYQCFFGGKPISVYLAGKNRSIHIEGSPPKVLIGEKNLDFIVGKIQMVINAKKGVALYLDARPQKFYIDGKAFILKFADSLKSVVINTVKFPVAFDGIPISISVRGRRKFLTFSVLPPGIIPGQINILGMDSPDLVPNYNIYRSKMRSNPPVSGFGGSLPPPAINPPPGPPSNLLSLPNLNLSSRLPAPPPLPPMMNMMTHPPLPHPMGSIRPMSLHSTQPGFVNQVNPMMSQPPPQYMIPPSTYPAPMSSFQHHPVQSNVTPGSYMVGGNTSVPPPPPRTPLPPSISQKSSQNRAIDVNFLLDSLYKTGILTSKTDNSASKDQQLEEETEEEEEEEEEEEDFSVPVEDMMKSENMKKRSRRRIADMYNGMQCLTCGARFSAAQTVLYSLHLDWHFKQGKKLSKALKKPISRSYFCTITDWIEFTEDLDERAPRIFEEEDSMSDDEDNRVEDEPCVPVNANDVSLGVCHTCHETFYQLFKSDIKEWHYKNAVQVDGVNYHPSCLNQKFKFEEDTKPDLGKNGSQFEEEVTPLELPNKIMPIIDLGKNEHKDTINKEDKNIDSSNTNSQHIKDINISDCVSKRLNNTSNLIVIKQEPLDDKLNQNVKIKQEIKVEPQDTSYEPPVIPIESNEDTPMPVSVPTSVPMNMMSTVVSSSIDGNLELANNTALDTERKANGPKIKISLASVPQTTVTTTVTVNTAATNGVLEHESEVVPDKPADDMCGRTFEEFIPPPFTVDLDKKPGFKDVTLTDQPLVCQGLEASGLCSVM